MRKSIVIALLAIISALSMSAASTPSAKRTNRETVVLSCDLHCHGCCDKIMKNIAFEKGVKDLVCDLKTKTVTVTYDTSKTDMPTLLEAFKKIGKPATVKADDEGQKDNDAPKQTDADTGATQLQ